MDFMSTAQVLGNFGELFGAIAVVVTLGFLTFQIRQSSKANTSTFQLQIQSEFTRTVEEIVGNDRLLQLLAACRNNTLPTDLEPEDRERLRFYVLSDLNTYAGGIMAFANNQIDERTYGWYRESFKQISVEAYPALIPIYRELLVAPELKSEPMFRPLFEET